MLFLPDKFKDKIKSAAAFLGARADLGNGDVMSVIVRLAVPAVAMMLFHTFFHLVDTVFVSWLGDFHMAAISYTFPLQIGVFAVIEGIGTGTTALVGRYLGKNEPQKADTVAKCGLALGYMLALMWVPMMIPAVSDKVFTLMGASSPEILRQAWLYNVWLAPTVFFITFGYMSNGVFRCQGDAITPFVSMVSSNALNVVLDPIFIFAFGWGIGGAAFATFLSRIAASWYLSRKMRKSSAIVLPFIPRMTITKNTFQNFYNILQIGIPLAISTGSVALGMGGINKILSGFGHQAVAAWLIGLRVEDLSFNTILGIQSALIPFLAFNYGKGDWNRMKLGIKCAMKLGFFVMLGFGIILCIQPQPIIALFKPNPDIAAIAVKSIRISVLGYPFTIVQLLCNAFFAATGYAYFGAVCQIIRSLVLRVAAAQFLAQKYGGIENIWWFQPISWLGGAILASIFALFLARKIKLKLSTE